MPRLGSRVRVSFSALENKKQRKALLFCFLRLLETMALARATPFPLEGAGGDKKSARMPTHRGLESRFPLQIKTASDGCCFLFSGLSSKDLHCPASYEAQRSFQSRSLRDFIIPSMRCFFVFYVCWKRWLARATPFPLEGARGDKKSARMPTHRGFESRFPLQTKTASDGCCFCLAVFLRKTCIV